MPRGLFGSIGLDGSPFMIGECVAHNSNSQFGSLNHSGLADSNARSPILMVRRLRPKADIHQLTVPFETVENDPELTSGLGLSARGRPNGRAMIAFEHLLERFFRARLRPLLSTRLDDK